jgi:ATP-dependent DNA helicase PIF1
MKVQDKNDLNLLYISLIMSLLYNGINTNLTQEMIDVISKGKNCFITGGAGTGKSSLLCAIYNYFKNTTNTQVVSSTAVSALSINGRTIHSWSGIKLGKDPAEKIAYDIRNREPYGRWKTCRLLLIDEISMIGGNLFDLISSVGDLINNKTPFGGIQLVIFGDFLQLPPILIISRILLSLIMRKIFHQKI